MLEEHLEKNKDSQNYSVEATEQASTLQSYYSVDFRRKNKTRGKKQNKATPFFLAFYNHKPVRNREFQIMLFLPLPLLFDVFLWLVLLPFHVFS